MRMLMLCVLLGLMGIAQAGDLVYGPYQATVVRVKDGDTVLVDVAIWPGLTRRVSVRLLGIDTPEKRGRKALACEKRAAQAATAFTQRWLAGAEAVALSDVRLGKYAGRVLGRLSRDGRDLGEALIAAGHGRVYAGGPREPWCSE